MSHIPNTIEQSPEYQLAQLRMTLHQLKKLSWDLVIAADQMPTGFLDFRKLRATVAREGAAVRVHADEALLALEILEEAPIPENAEEAVRLAVGIPTPDHVIWGIDHEKCEH